MGPWVTALFFFFKCRQTSVTYMPVFQQRDDDGGLPPQRWVRSREGMACIAVDHRAITRYESHRTTYV